MFSEISPTSRFTFFRHEQDKKNIFIPFSVRERSLCQKIVSKKKREKKKEEEKRKKVTRVVNMLINSWTRFLLVLKETGGFLEIKQRGERKKEKRKKKERILLGWNPFLGQSFITFYHRTP